MERYFMNLQHKKIFTLSSIKKTLGRNITVKKLKNLGYIEIKSILLKRLDETIIAQRRIKWMQNKY